MGTSDKFFLEGSDLVCKSFANFAPFRFNNLLCYLVHFAVVSTSLTRLHHLRILDAFFVVGLGHVATKHLLLCEGLKADVAGILISACLGAGLGGD